VFYTFFNYKPYRRYYTTYPLEKLDECLFRIFLG